MYFALLFVTLASQMKDSETKTSQKQRMYDWDYKQPRIYMITLATEGRKPLLGSLTGDVTRSIGQHDAPRIEPTPLGAYVEREVWGIPRYYPQIRIYACQLMPDHLHILLHVTEPLPVHLGKVIAGFKMGCNRGWRDMQQNSMTPNQALKPQEPAPQHAGSVGGVSIAANTSHAIAPPQPQQPLWEQGYNDRVLSGAGQLDTLRRYINDNPRRALIKRQHQDMFRIHTISIAGRACQAIGNVSLLHAEHKTVVYCSRRLTASELSTRREEILSAARAGAVLVSPFISPGERQIEKAAIHERIPIIKIVDNGFSEYYKPQGEYFELCAEGKLLLISPFAYSNQKVTLTREVCNQLNDLATKIVK